LGFLNQAILIRLIPVADTGEHGPVK